MAGSLRGTPCRRGPELKRAEIHSASHTLFPLKTPCERWPPLNLIKRRATSHLFYSSERSELFTFKPTPLIAGRGNQEGGEGGGVQVWRPLDRCTFPTYSSLVCSSASRRQPGNGADGIPSCVKGILLLCNSPSSHQGVAALYCVRGSPWFSSSQTLSGCWDDDDNDEMGLIQMK